MTSVSRRTFGRLGLAGLGAIGGARGAGAWTPAPVQTPGSRAYRYIHVDVFTDKRMQGNQLLVFVDPAGLDANAMQALTKESNYSECTFVFPPDAAGTDHRVRIFTRTAETSFAGHPTLGTAFALAHIGVLTPSMTHTMFGLGVGPTNVDLEWKNGLLAFTWMTQQKPAFGKALTDAASLAASIGLDAASIDTRAPAQEVYSGSTFVIVPLKTRKAVDAATLDRAKVDAVFAAAGVQRRGFYVFSTERGQDDVDAYSRMLGAGAIEDVATGSAVGPAGCFAAKYGLVPSSRADSMVFLQGVKAGRPSLLQVNVAMTGGEVSGVKVGGAAAIVGEGTMSL
jgi:trans-2,3-dihydro-3-hydroxyanthranilate isomerase